MSIRWKSGNGDGFAWFGDAPPTEVADTYYALQAVTEAEKSLAQAWRDANEAMDYLGRIVVPMLTEQTWVDILNELDPTARRALVNAASVAGVLPRPDRP